jgi:hypothetical protein
MPVFNVFTAANHAGRRTGQLDKVLSDWTPLEHTMKGSDFVNSNRCDSANRSRLVHGCELHAAAPDPPTDRGIIAAHL